MYLCMVLKLSSPVFLLYLGFVSIYNVGVSLIYFFIRHPMLYISHHFLPLPVLIVRTAPEFSRSSENKMSFTGNVLVRIGNTLTITVSLLQSCIQICEPLNMPLKYILKDHVKTTLGHSHKQLCEMIFFFLR